MSAHTTELPPPQPCGICSNGTSQVYHLGGPCPYLSYPNYCPHCGGSLAQHWEAREIATRIRALTFEEEKP